MFFCHADDRFDVFVSQHIINHSAVAAAADELGLREMLSPDGVTKARKAALERLRSRYPGSGLHLWRDVYHALKDI